MDLVSFLEEPPQKIPIRVYCLRFGHNMVSSTEYMETRGMASEQGSLMNLVFFSGAVKANILNVKASSTRRLNALKSILFASWSRELNLNLLLELFLLKVCVATISAEHILVAGTLRQHSIVCHFMCRTSFLFVLFPFFLVTYLWI